MWDGDLKNNDGVKPYTYDSKESAQKSEFWQSLRDKKRVAYEKAQKYNEVADRLLAYKEISDKKTQEKLLEKQGKWLKEQDLTFKPNISKPKKAAPRPDPVKIGMEAYL